MEEIRSKNRTINNLERQLSESKQALEKVRLTHAEELQTLKNRFVSFSKIFTKKKKKIIGTSFPAHDILMRFFKKGNPWFI